MSRKHRRRHAPKIVRRSAPGAPPGVVIADPSQPKPEIHVMAYGPGDLVENDVSDAAAAHAVVGQRAVTWVNVEGLGDAKTIEQFGELFDLHRLALEDTVNLHQRAKIETYGEILFVVLRMVHRGNHGA